LGVQSLIESQNGAKMSLIVYIAELNGYARFFGNRTYDLNDQADRHGIARQLDLDLSPENLMQDGELSWESVQGRRKFLLSAMAELQEFDSSVKFDPVY
jgi:hypothetical protein